MTGAQMKEIGSAALLAISTMLFSAAAVAGSVDINDLYQAPDEITGPLNARLDDSSAAFLGRSESAFWSISPSVKTTKVAPQLVARGGDNRRDGGFEYPVALKGPKGGEIVFEKGEALVLDVTQPTDVPLPPALLLLSSAILGLVIVGRRDRGSS